jgi:hypothetical protein
MKRGERVVTIVRRDAMDVGVARDERHGNGRRRRAGPAPQWQVPNLAGDDPKTTVTTKPGLTGVSTT